MRVSTPRRPATCTGEKNTGLTFICFFFFACSFLLGQGGNLAELANSWITWRHSQVKVKVCSGPPDPLRTNFPISQMQYNPATSQCLSELHRCKRVGKPAFVLQVDAAHAISYGAALQPAVQRDGRVQPAADEASAVPRRHSEIRISPSTCQYIYISLPEQQPVQQERQITKIPPEMLRHAMPKVKNQNSHAAPNAKWTDD